MFWSKKIIFLLCLVSGISGCTTLDKITGRPVNEGNGYSIDHDRKIYGGGVHIEYRDTEFLEREVKERMENRMASESELQEALKNIPAGGRIQVHYEATTIEAANTKWLEYVVLKDGEEVYRRDGSDDIAETPTDYSGGIGFWWNIDIVDIREPIATPFEFIVISNLKNERDSFTISKP